MLMKNKKIKDLKVAICCDWLTNYGGAERVISLISDIFPNADIYTSVFNKEKMREFSGKKIIESFISKLPFARTKHQIYLPWMPYAFETFDFSDYDLVISSSHSCAKGIITSTSTVHICYCHSPTRYLWDNCQEYLKTYGWYRFPFRFLIDLFLSSLRQWDRIAAERPDFYIANSKFIQKRISKYYQRDSKVIYPPVNLDRFANEKIGSDYYLAVGRLIPYKRFDLLVEVFNKLDLPLVIIGTGKEYESLKKKANRNIVFAGFVSEEDLPVYYSKAKALLFPQVEDFGIVPLEAMAAGVPVIAFRKGGAVETVKEGVSGVFFDEQTVESIYDAVKKFEDRDYRKFSDVAKVRKIANSFSDQRFKDEFTAFLDSVL